MGSLELAPRIPAKLLCSCLRLFGIIIALRVMDEKCSMTFSLESESGVICSNGLFDS